MSAENVTPLPEPPIRLSAAREASWFADPTRRAPLVDCRVEENTYYGYTPHRVVIDVKAGTPEEALTALRGAYRTAQAQLRAVIDQAAADAGESR